jgi:hypothetical protein
MVDLPKKALPNSMDRCRKTVLKKLLKIAS